MPVVKFFAGLDLEQKSSQTFDFSNPLTSVNAYKTSNTWPIGLFINSSNFKPQ